MMNIAPAVRKKTSQLSLPGFSLLDDAISTLARSTDVDERGAIYTRKEVVEFILDLVDYSETRALYKMRLLEPSAGAGDFLIPAIERLLKSYRAHFENFDFAVSDLSHCITAVELHTETAQSTRNKIFYVLLKEGLSNDQAIELIDHWLVQGDFLIVNIHNTFDFVVGNPPYVRQELIPETLIKEYRDRYHTIYDRADLYVPFIERSLTLLGRDGQLGFICADRWMKNRYGGPLRKFISDNFHLKYYVDMVDTPAFLSEVNAYPAITVFTKNKQKTTRIAHCPKISSTDLSELATLFKLSKPLEKGSLIKEMEGVVLGSEPWILQSIDQLSIVRKLETQFPLLEETGCKVGIGVATGLDKVFIGKYDELNVEPDRKLPLATTKDLQGDLICWRGLGVINPFNDDGSLVDLEKYPLLKKYLNNQKDQILKRHVASKNPTNWYRTIDRISPTLAAKEKLLIPDIKGEAHIVYEEGKLYPHHNLYYITTNDWDIKALQAVLRSGIARLFVSIYSTKMRGGYFRFQAQYLRRIRIPHWKDVSTEIKQELLNAADQNDTVACNSAVFKLYGLTKAECEAVGGNGQ